MLLLCLGAGFF
ncbi:MAG TPA: hypothetical protein HPP66_06360 [Planctomycetes bacterium]|nr:hypothetical protein [Planctomycetota bacterium]